MGNGGREIGRSGKQDGSWVKMSCLSWFDRCGGEEVGAFALRDMKCLGTEEDGMVVDLDGWGGL